MHVLNAWGVRRDLSSFGCCVVVDVVCQRPDATLNIPGRGDGGDGGVGGDSCYMVCLQCHLLSWQARSHAHTQTQKCSLTWIHLLYLTDGGWRGGGVMGVVKLIDLMWVTVHFYHAPDGVCLQKSLHINTQYRVYYLRLTCSSVAVCGDQSAQAEHMPDVTGISRLIIGHHRLRDRTSNGWTAMHSSVRLCVFVTAIFFFPPHWSCSPNGDQNQVMMMSQNLVYQSLL